MVLSKKYLCLKCFSCWQLYNENTWKEFLICKKGQKIGGIWNCANFHGFSFGEWLNFIVICHMIIFDALIGSERIGYFSETIDEEWNFSLI